MGTDKQRAGPARKSKEPKPKVEGRPASTRGAYTGMELDAYMALSYTERVELGLESGEVPEGPDHITADDIGRHGGYILRARQIVQAHERHINDVAAFLERFKLERDDIDPESAELTLAEIVEIYRRAIVAVEEAGMLALAEPQLSTLSILPRERPVDIALREVGELKTSLDAAAETAPREVGIWEFRGMKLDATSRTTPSGNVAEQTKQEGDVTVRLLRDAKQMFASLGSDYTKAPPSAKRVGFSILIDPFRKSTESAFLRLVFAKVYAAGRPVEPGEKALATLTEAARIDAEANKRIETPLKRDRLVGDIRYLHAQLLAPEITVDERLFEAWHVRSRALNTEAFVKDKAWTTRATRLRLAWLISKYDEKPHHYAKTVDEMRIVEDARLYLKQHAVADLDVFSAEAADAFTMMIANIPTMGGPAVTIDGKTVVTYAEAADWQKNWEKKVAFELLYALTVGLGYVVNLVIGFGKGLLDWVLELASIVEGIGEFVSFLWKVQKRLMKALLTGDLGGVIAQMVDEVISLVMKLPDILGELLDEFLGNWNHRDPFKQARYRGKVVGYLTAEIVVAALTAGASLGARASSKVGKIVFRFLKKSGKLDDAAGAAKHLGLGKIVDDLADAAPKHLPDIDLPKPRPDIDVPRKPPDVDVDVPKHKPDVEPDVDVPEPSKAPELEPPTEAPPTKKKAKEKQKKPKQKSEGQQLAEDLGYPADPGPGYHWAVLEVDGKRIPVVKLSPRKGGNPRPRKRYNPEKKQFELLSKQWQKCDYDNIAHLEPCFPPGTLVATSGGPRTIECLRAGDRVLSYDLECERVVERTVASVHSNFAVRLARVHTQDDTYVATRMHRFFIDDTRAWVPARQMWPGMVLRGLHGDRSVVDRVDIEEVETATYNLVVEHAHTYFVGEHPVLVHNGTGSDSSFAKPDKTEQAIYGIWDKAKRKFIYVGKSDDIQERFKQHLQKKKHWRDRKAFLETRPLHQGNWTVYETAVWEKHFIEKHKLLNPDLENDGNPISKKSFEKFKDLHLPCK